MFELSGSYTDLYELTMAEAWFRAGRQDEKAVFDYFFRRLPFSGGYALLAGLEDLLAQLEQLRFSPRDLEYLAAQGLSSAFLAWLENFRFRGSVYAPREGDVVFPLRPVLQVEASLIEAQLIETLLLNVLNFQTLIATKASRMRTAAGSRPLLDFGLRRAQGLGGYWASRAAYIGGCNASSNVLAGRDYGIPVSGTMAHSFVQSHVDELSAFRAYAAARPEGCVLLVDTYDTLQSGLPNAITVAAELAAHGKALQAIRLDSGDFVRLSRAARAMLDAAGFTGVKIAASNQLDEYSISELLARGAAVDVFGVGTSLVTGHSDGSLDGVYKLCWLNGQPSIKLSENAAKTSLPHRKQVYRLADDSGRWLGLDLVTLRDEALPDAAFIAEPDGLPSAVSLSTWSTSESEALLWPIMIEGKRTLAARNVSEIADYARERLALLPAEYKKLQGAAQYRVALSPGLQAEQARLVAAAERS
ncbi:MAG: nicotinate phosphoribosyltransferase [Spirochaetes bacterium]|nr:nicotinate phosphoribosyltransferase [Spirochaetota bacterium]